jgi:hypothetical protein
LLGLHGGGAVRSEFMALRISSLSFWILVLTSAWPEPGAPELLDTAGLVVVALAATAAISGVGGW